MARRSAALGGGARMILWSPEVHSRPDTVASYRTAVERVVLAMRENLDQELTLDEMAALAHLSPFHFLRVFRRLTGVPPGQFLAALRLEEAKRRLLLTDDSVTDICFAVGYSSLGTFTSRFTQLVGLPPTQLRVLGRSFDLEHFAELAQYCDHSGGAAAGRIDGRLETAGTSSGLIFIGLFANPVPQDRPLACALATGSGPFRVLPPGDGRYFLFAAGLRWPEAALDLLLADRSVRAVASAGPITVRGGKARGGTTLALRPPDVLDPPLLVTLPLLITERLATAAAG